GKKIKDPGFAGFLLNLFETDVQILGQIAKRVVHYIKTQRFSDIIGRRRISAAAVAGNRYPKSSGFGNHDALPSYPTDRRENRCLLTCRSRIAQKPLIGVPNSIFQADPWLPAQLPETTDIQELPWCAVRF